MVPLLIGFVIATGMALFAHRYRWLNPWFLAIVSALFTVPSIAFYLILLNVTGRGFNTAVVVLTAYTLVLIYRNVTTGLQEVPQDMVDAAEGMGLTRRQILFRVELPMALPTIFAGLRIAASSTVGIAGFAFFAGAGGLGAEAGAAHRRDVAAVDERVVQGLAPLPSFIVPLPSLRSPSQTAEPLRSAIIFSWLSDREPYIA